MIYRYMIALVLIIIISNVISFWWLKQDLVFRTFNDHNTVLLSTLTVLCIRSLGIIISKTLTESLYL